MRQMFVAQWAHVARPMNSSGARCGLYWNRAECARATPTTAKRVAVSLGSDAWSGGVSERHPGLVSLPMMQRQRSAAAGLNLTTYVTGYRGLLP